MAQLFYSGGASNKFASASIGGLMSNTQIPNSQIDNLFDDVTRVEVINGRTEYRLFYIYNESGTNYFQVSLKNIVIPVDTEISFAVDGSANPQTLSTEDEVPSGLSFYKFSEWNSLKIPIGNLATLKSIPVWIKRKVLQGSSTVRNIDFDIDGNPNTLTITQDFSTVQNLFDNFEIQSRSSQFLTDIDKVGEALLS